LQAQLNWHKARIKFLALFNLALVKVSTVNFVKLASALSGKAKKESNYRRIQRFFANYEIYYRHIAGIILKLLPQKIGFIISIDRTNWKFDKLNINIFNGRHCIYQTRAHHPINQK
jgi:hypothetical protein